MAAQGREKARVLGEPQRGVKRGDREYVVRWLRGRRTPASSPHRRAHFPARTKRMGRSKKGGASRRGMRARKRA
jgi:hypothetical protein